MSNTVNTTIVNKAQRHIDEVQATLEMLYEKAAEIVATHSGYRDLARITERIAVAEGEKSAYTLIKTHIGNCSILEIAAERLGQGADDTWSGRTNDANRSFFEGLTKAFNTARRWSLL